MSMKCTLNKNQLAEAFRNNGYNYFPSDFCWIAFKDHYQTNLTTGCVYLVKTKHGETNCYVWVSRNGRYMADW